MKLRFNVIPPFLEFSVFPLINDIPLIGTELVMGHLIMVRLIYGPSYGYLGLWWYITLHRWGSNIVYHWILLL